MNKPKQKSKYYKFIIRFDKNKILYSSGKLKCAKDVCIGDLELENGKYVVIPAYKNADTYGSFTLSIYFDCEKYKQI